MQTAASQIQPPAPSAPSTAGLRLLDITGFYSDRAGGGVKTYLHAKASRLAQRGVGHALIVPGADSHTRSLGATRVHTVKGPVLPVSPAYHLLLSAERVRQVIDEEDPDVIEVGSPFLVPPLVRRATRGRRVPTVGFYHADLVRTFAEPYLPHRAAAPLRMLARGAARRLARSVYDRFDVTVAASASVARELRSLGIRRVVHVPLGVALDRFHPEASGDAPTRAQLAIADGVPAGVYVGRYCAEKGLDVALAGHARIPLARRPHLVFVGGGPHERKLQARAAVEPRLTVLPYVSDRDTLAALYASMDFYLAPGPGETFGLAIGEALASGLPVVAVDRGAGPDRVRGAGVATRYRHGDADDAARALESMAGWVQREGDALRRRARAHAEASLDWDRTVDRLLDIYTDLARAQAR